MLTMATGNRVHAPKARGFDLYETPAVAVQALLRLEPVPLTVWEPSCGPGAIVKVLRESGRAVIATDLVDYGDRRCPDSQAGVDFLLTREAPAGIPAIVMNPPFMHADAFVAKALALAPEVYALLRVAFLEGLRWGSPDDFVARPLDGKKARGLAQHLARVHVFCPRLPMMHRDGFEGRKNANSGMPFAWFVFRRNHAKLEGPATVHQCFWRELLAKRAIAQTKPASRLDARKRATRRSQTTQLDLFGALP
jgi:hypothetical protein